MGFERIGQPQPTDMSRVSSKEGAEEAKELAAAKAERLQEGLAAQDRLEKHELVGLVRLHAIWMLLEIPAAVRAAGWALEARERLGRLFRCRLRCLYGSTRGGVCSGGFPLRQLESSADAWSARPYSLVK